MSTQPLAKYQEVEVMTMPPERRVVFLYTLLLTSLLQGKVALEAGQIELRVQRLTKAQDVLQELLGSLDLEAGGAIAESLKQLYGWLLVELIEVNARKDAARLDRVIRVVRELHEAWTRAAESLTADAASQPA